MRILLLLISFFITYGSLYPFDYVPHVAAVTDLYELFLTWPERASMIDAVGNVLLFIPYGLCVPSVSRAAKGRAAWLVAGLALAWSIQYVQFWFPSRVPSGSDAWFNTFGIVIGLALGGAAQAWLARHRDLASDAPPLWFAATGLMLCWLLYRWFPLVPTVDLQNIKNGLKPLFLSPEWEFHRVLHDAVAWLAFFRLARYSILFRVAPLWLCLGAAAILMAEPVFEHNAVSWSNLIGLALALLLRPLFFRGPASLAMLTLLLAASIVVTELSPFDFSFGHGFHWLPFAGMLEGSMVVNLASLIEKIYLYGALIYLLDHLGLRARTGGVALAILLFALEWIQQWIPGHTAEITDAMLALLAAFCLSLLGRGQRTKRDRRPAGAPAVGSGAG